MKDSSDSGVKSNSNKGAIINGVRMKYVLKDIVTRARYKCADALKPRMFRHIYYSMHGIITHTYES